MPTVSGSAGTLLDETYRLRAASRMFQANTWTIRRKRFQSQIERNLSAKPSPPVARFGVVHLQIHASEFDKIDLEYRPLLCPIEGPPGHVDCDFPSQMMLHALNACVPYIYIQYISGNTFAMFAGWKGFQLHGFGRRVLIWCLACVRTFHAYTNRLPKICHVWACKLDLTLHCLLSSVTVKSAPFPIHRGVKQGCGDSYGSIVGWRLDGN